MSALVTALVLLLAAPAAPLTPPVPDPVVAGFAAPACRWCPGHRGITYATTPGEDVRAAAAGVVTFAGVVAGTVYVVVAHGTSLRTTYGRLQHARVVAGDRVDVGQLLGTSGPTLHFGVRIDARYVDPMPLLATVRRRARLLPLG